MANAIENKENNVKAESEVKSDKKSDNENPSRILSKLFEQVKEEKTEGADKINPKGHYVRGAHTEGVYHKHYNRY